MRLALLLLSAAVSSTAVADDEYDIAIRACQAMMYVPADYRTCWNKANAEQAARRQAEQALNDAKHARDIEAAKIKDTAVDVKSKARTPSAKKAAAETAPQRARLSAEYNELLIRAYPSLNFIKMRTMPMGSTFALYGQHAMFSRYSFQVGPAGPAIQQWVGIRDRDLRAAGISRVGVQSDDGSATWFVVR